MEDTEFLTDAELDTNAKPSKNNLDEQDLAGLDAEVAARNNALKATLRQSVPVNPDDAAKSKALSTMTGLPTDVVDRNKDEVETNARVQQIGTILADSPILARQMRDPEFAKLSHDNVENLSLFERTFRTYLGASAKSGMENLLGTTAKIVDDINPFTTSERDAAILFKDKPQELKEFQDEHAGAFLTRFARAMQQASEATMADVNPDAKAEYSGLEYATTDLKNAAYLSPIKVVGDAIQSLPTTLALAVSMYLTKGAAGRVEAEALAAGMSPELARQAAIHAAAETMAKLGAVTEGAAGYGQQSIQTREQVEKIPQAALEISPEYQRLINTGYSPEAARLALSAITAQTAGTAAGVADAVTNYFGGQFLGRVIGEGGALMARIAKGFAGEAATEGVQSGLEQFGQNAAIRQFMDVNQELLDGVAESVAQGLVVGGVMGGSFAAVAGRKTSAEKAAEQADVMKKLMDLAKSDVLRERSPEEFGKFVQATADEHGTSAVYVDAAVFAQAAQDKGLDLATLMPETAAQMQEAIALKTDVRVPLGELVAVIPGTGLEDVFLQNMRMAPDAPTMKEATDKKFVEDTQKLVEQAMSLSEASAVQNSSAATVERELLTQLTEANRFTKNVNAAYAKLMSSFYKVLAARTGKTAEEMYVKYPLRIQAEQIPLGKGVMDQGNVAPAKEGVQSTDGQRPAEDSLDFTGAAAQPGEVVHRTLAGGNAEQGWAAATSIRRRNGKPALIHRGAQRALTAEDFGEAALGVNTGHPSSGLGVWFTIDPNEARGYGRVESFHLDIRNPLVVPVEELPGFEDVAAALAWREAVRAKGHDGLLITAKHLGGRTHLVAFEPSQVVVPSRTYAQDTIDNDTGKVMANAPFYSALAMQVAALKTNVAPAAQWKSIIASLSQKGVKKDEIAMSGVMDWLDTIGQPTPAEADAAKYNAIRAKNKDQGTLDDEANGIAARIFLTEGQSLEQAFDALNASPRVRVWIKRAIEDGTSDDGNAVSWRYAEDFLRRQIRERDESESALGEEAMSVWRQLMGANPQIKPAGQAAPIVLVGGESIGRWFTDTVPLQVKALVMSAVLTARQTSDTNSTVNWDYARDIVNRDAHYKEQAATVLANLKYDSEHDLPLTFEKPAAPTPNVPAVQEQPKPPTEKKDTRVPKQAVIDYLAKYGTRVEVKILGAPKSEQDGYVPTGAVVPAAVVSPNDLPPGFGVSVMNGQTWLLGPVGGMRAVLSAIEANEAAEQYINRQHNLPALPDDYSYTYNEDDNQFVIEVPRHQGGDIYADSRQEAMELLNEHYDQYRDDQVPSEPDDDMVEERAKELVKGDAQQIAEDYARDSEYANYSFQVAFRPPNYRVVKVESSRGITDMFTGRETPEHYRVVPLEFKAEDLPKDDAVVDTDSGRSLAQESMPTDADDFEEMFDFSDDEPVGPEFTTKAAAELWASENIDDARATPVWILWDRENYGGRHDPETGDNEGVFDSFSEAHDAAESRREDRYASEVEQMKDDIENDPENYVDLSRYERQAREELERELQDERPEPWFSEATIRSLPVGWQHNQGHVEEDEEDRALRLQHKNNYQSDGGENYREVVVGVPNVEAYNERDTTHFGHVFKGKTIAWARVKEHKLNSAEGKDKGDKVLFVEEIQSQRAQAGREEGFKRTKPATPEETAALEAASKTQYEAETALDNYLNTLAENLGQSRIFTYSRLQQQDAEDYANADERALVVKGQVEAKALWKAMKAARENYDEINRKVSGGPVPSAPFTAETQDWAAVTLKRLVRYAADRGLKHVVWTQGLEQVERYEGALRKAVRVLRWTKTEKGIEFEADGNPVKRNRNDNEGAVFSEKEIRSVVGAHIAQKVINDPNQSGEVSGEDIKLDDLWPAGFYGDANGLNANGKPAVMTIVANKVFKGLGGGEVKSYDITVDEDGKSYQGAPGFEITDKMRAAALSGQPLFQEQGPNARGQIAFGESLTKNPTVLTLLQNADLSTFLHESGHFYLEVMADIATQPDAPVEIMGDMQKILNWFGVPDLATWNGMTLEEKRPYHEQFARGFESYLFTGKAPSTELASLFARFRAWLINVYKQISSLNVTLTPEVTGVFDRMLASNDEIVQAETLRGYMPLFSTAAEMGATPEEWKNYQELGMAATQDAVDTLQTRSLRDMKWLGNAKSRELKRLQKDAASKRKAVTKEVTDEVRSQPVYAAIRFLTHGELQMEGFTSAQRKALEDFAGHASKLSIPDLKRMYGEGPAAAWRYLNAGPYGHIAAEDGLDPNLVAELFAFTSGDHLVREILAAEPEANVIEGMTDQRMLERYGDLSSPAAIDQAANAAIHNEARGRFIATEVQALTKAAGQRKILVPAAKEFAATLVARKKVRDIKPSQYEHAETRAAKAAERAASLVEKATEKRNQLVNHYAARAAYDAQEEVEKAVAYLRRVGESKTIDPSYREQIQALLARFELREVTNKDAKRRESLLQWADEQRKQGLEPVIDEELYNESLRTPYQDMTLEDFRGVVDAVRNIEHLGRLKHKLLTLQDQREFVAVTAEAADAINKHAKKTLREPLERTKWVKIKSGFAEFFAMHRKFAMMLREMDGHEDNGVMWKLFGRPMNDAGDTETSMREEATKKLAKLLKPVLKEGRMAERRFIPEIRASLSREGRIMVALNMGNAGNLQRLLDGDRWTMDQATAILNTLTKTEMDFVQGVWDFIGSYKKEIGEQQKRITGVSPEWVEPRPVTTIHGEYAGGYIPAKYDTSRSTRSLSYEAAAGVMDMWRAKRGAAKTRDSFTKERANKVVDRPLRKDLGVVFQHVTEVTHRLSWQEFLIDAQRLLRSGKIDSAIREHYGPEVLKAMRDSVEDIAAGEVGAQNAFEAAINYVRTGATIAGLGWRLTTALLQPIGLTQSMVRIGARHVGKGLVEWIGDAAKMENTAAKIYEKSTMMRLRGKTMQREISEIRNQVAGKNSAIEASYFYLIQKMQLVADIPTWLGQYHKSVEAGADEKSAVAQADQAVLDAQGGGQIKDLAGIQRGGPLMKLFTNFYSFFNTTYNLTSEAVGRTKWRDPVSVGRLAVDFLLLYSLPAALGTLMKAALHSGDDDDDDKLWRQLIADQLTYLFGTMVGVREIAGVAQTAAGLPGDYSGPASVRVFSELAKLGKQVNQGEIDEALLKAANNTAGILFHYPAGQIGATLDGIVTMADGRTGNPGALLVGSNKK